MSADYIVVEVLPDQFRTLFHYSGRLTMDKAVEKMRELTNQFPHREFVVMGIAASLKKTTTVTLEVPDNVSVLRRK